MSNFAGHATAGILTSSIFGGALLYTKTKVGFDANDIIIPSASMLIFSLFPDIDIKSIPSKIFYSIILMVLGYCYINGLHQLGILIAMISLIPQLVSHRGIFHSPVTAIILPSSVFYLKYIGVIDLNLAILIYIASVIGYCVHLTLDRL